jgi:diguanylate cyclase (GGDEF)-like protein
MSNAIDTSGIPQAANLSSSEHLASLVALYDIIEHRRLTALFQPVIDLRHCTVIGYEALVRGPSDSPLHSPIKLLRLAHQAGLAYEIEKMCADVQVAAFVALKLPGRLFLNFSPNVLLLHGLLNKGSYNLFQNTGLEPSQVVIELAEHGYTADYSLDMLLSATRRYRDLGVKIALEDLGEGSSNLRLWSELRPDYIKIDRHLIQGVDKDPVKAQFVRSIQEIARSANSEVIAEGVETRAELEAASHLGISCAQGYHIARPVSVPSAVISAEVISTLRHTAQRIIGSDQVHDPRSEIEKQLLIRAPAVLPGMHNQEIFKLFEEDDSLLAVTVVDTDGQPLGLINRYHLIDRFARPYRHELYGKKPCTTFMDPEPLIVDRGLSIVELGQVIANADSRHITNGFIITEQGRYLGIGTTQQLMRVISEMQIQMARYANPLTQLPGNVPINEEIDRMLTAGISFVACYVDLDHFKPFNDVYGFTKGDDIIRLTGQVVTSVIDAELDFVGHIGGDDFIVLFRSEDWEQRCQMALQKFGELIPEFFSADDRERGGYVTENRKGQMEFHPLTSVSIGAVHVEPGMFTSRLEVARVAAEAKKKAKGIAGNSFFVNQRAYGPAAASPAVSSGPAPRA